MTDNELSFTADADPRVTSALRARYAAPRDEAYWDGLHARVTSRIAAGARPGWLQVAAGWARPGLAAAAAVLLVAAALFQATRAQADTVTFAGLTATDAAQPEFIYTEQDAASQRDETLRFVVSYR